MRILVVDDDDATRSLLSMLLSAEGHDVDTCSGGDEALARLAEQPYAALLTDLLMPGMSGLTLVRHARAFSAALRCVIITGQPAPPRAERDGVDWVQKPLNFEALLSSLDFVRP